MYRSSQRAAWHRDVKTGRASQYEHRIHHSTIWGLAVVQLKSAGWGCLWRKALSLNSAGGRCNSNHLFHGCSSSIRWMKWAMKLKGQSSK